MMSRRFPRQILVSLVLAMTACSTPTALHHELTLLEMYEVIKTKAFVDLTQLMRQETGV